MKDLLKLKVKLFQLGRKHWPIVSESKHPQGYYETLRIKDIDHGDVEVIIHQQRYCRGPKKFQLNYINVYFPALRKTAMRADIKVMVSALEKRMMQAA